jgi:23S rRNA (cytidine1920-2'-O)/16S rRNA (cytidine1409-2'-O)-methyltransferase
VRADQLLLQRAIASSRSQAQRLIASGVRWRVDLGADAGAQAAVLDSAWKRIGKNSDELPLDAIIELLDASEAKYVSRGGLKLEGALKATGVAVKGKTCLDVGQSTGGFTDCLLQHGAKLVVGVDVGSGQLHPSMRQHPQVVALEHVNARDLVATELVAAYSNNSRPEGLFDHEDGQNGGASVESAPGSAEGLDGDSSFDRGFDASFDLIVGDLSFISQTLVLPALVPLLKPGADLLMLVKPQFELQPGQVGKGGIVKDAAMYKIVEKRIRDSCAELGLKVIAWVDSPITGGDGNREFFVHARRLPGALI